MTSSERWKIDIAESLIFKRFNLKTTIDLKNLFQNLNIQPRGKRKEMKDITVELKVVSQRIISISTQKN